MSVQVKSQTISQAFVGMKFFDDAVPRIHNIAIQSCVKLMKALL